MFVEKNKVHVFLQDVQTVLLDILVTRARYETSVQPVGSVFTPYGWLYFKNKFACELFLLTNTVF